MGTRVPVQQYNLRSADSYIDESSLHDLNTVDGRAGEIIEPMVDGDAVTDGSLDNEDDSGAVECMHESYQNSLPLHNVGVDGGHSSLDTSGSSRDSYNILSANDISPIETARARFLDFVVDTFIGSHVVEVTDSETDMSQSVEEKTSKRKTSDIQYEGDPQYVLPLMYVANMYETLVNEVNMRISSLDGMREKTIGVALEAAGGLYRKLAKKFPRKGVCTFKRRELATSFETRSRFPELVIQEEKRVRFVVINGLDIIEKPTITHTDNAEWFKRLTGRGDVAVSPVDYKFYAPRHKYRRTGSNSVSSIPGFPTFPGADNSSPMSVAQGYQAEMYCTRSKSTLNKPHYNTIENPPKPDIFKNLISALEYPGDMKSQLLKCAYYLLIQLSSKKQICTGKGAEFNEFLIETNEGEVMVSIRDVHTLSSILFNNLQKRLKLLNSSKHDVSSTRSLELEELALLIRCCMVTLTVCLPQERLLESGRLLLLIFKKLSLLEVAENGDCKNLLTSQCMYSGEITSDYFAEVAAISSLEIFGIPSTIAILEVILDELLVHGQLRKYLRIIDSFSPNERLFKVSADSGDFGLMMEMVCSHFSLSISDEVALQEFLNMLTWGHSNNSKSLALGIIPAKTLMQNPIVLSSPKLLQAHVVSLVADVISVGKDCLTHTPDPILSDCYLSLFENSVILYTQHMSILKTENQSINASGNLINLHDKSSHPSFESCIDPGKSEKLYQMISALNNSWNSNLRGEFFETKPDLITSSIDYIQQNQCIIDITCRDEILAFLKCMIIRAANDVNDIQRPLHGDASLQDICLLASLLMLMSNSLIQALKRVAFCKAYDVIVGIINCFKEFSIRLPIQKLSYTLMERNPTSHKESRLMLLHFVGLLSLSFDSGLGFLVKSCISVIMGLSNLFVLEEGNIEALKSLAKAYSRSSSSSSSSSSSEGSLTIYREAFVCQYPTLGVAAKFQKTRALYVSHACATNESTTQTEMENLSSKLNVTRETCSGEAYLKARNVRDDIDDLANFVECHKDKDYVAYLNHREKLRAWKLEKQAKLTWEKKKQAWRRSMITKT